ncbi:enolase, partial [Cloacibacillus evryensis]|nr:enolase [Cloacibacillus evryensis]
LRDGDPNEYDGLSVHKAVENVNNRIAPALIGPDIADQAAIDHIMIGLDGTPDKQVLGGNAIYSASIAAFRAAAEEAGMPLYDYIARGPIMSVPIPSFNVINGGRYPG